MQGVPDGLIYVLILVGVMLVQFVLKRFVPQPESPSLPQEPADAEVFAEEQPPVETPTERTAPPSRTVPAQESAAAPARAGHGPRRYSRSALLGTRRATQDAVVITTILGQCRALAPHDSAQPDRRPPSAGKPATPQLRQ